MTFLKLYAFTDLHYENNDIYIFFSEWIIKKERIYRNSELCRARKESLAERKENDEREERRER